MKYTNALILFLSARCFTGQATPFINLDFERAIIPSGTQFIDSIPVGQAIPGWQSPYTGVIYDGLSIGGPLLSIEDGKGQSLLPLSDSYSVLLNGGGTASVSISQTGRVPDGTSSLQFEAQSYGYPFSVSMGGQTLTPVVLSSSAAYSIYGADISSFSGQTATLTFTSLPYDTPPPAFLLLDNISFSPNPIPEPSSLLLLASGIGLLTVSRKISQAKP